MAFRELMEGMKLPEGASERFRKLDALRKMLTGELYEDLAYSFETEKANGDFVQVRKRRPGVQYSLQHLLTQDTLAELFGDEQFPTVQVLIDGEHNEDATSELGEICESIALQDVVVSAYEEGVVGSVGVVIHAQPNGMPFYEIIQGNFCEPIYRTKYSDELLALNVTYPIDKKDVEKKYPELFKNAKSDEFWYRFIVGPDSTIDYYPLPADEFAHLGEKNSAGDIIEFKIQKETSHGFKGKVPAIFARNLQRIRRVDSIDGPCLWWPIRDACIEIDYTLSQAGRGLRFCADPLLFLKRGDMFDLDDIGPGGGMSTQNTGNGEMVRGVTNVLVGDKDSDAELLQISAEGIKEEREYVRDLREYSLEVVGGMKARAENHKGMDSGKAIDKATKPLRRLVRRQRRPYGNGLVLQIVNLTLYGFNVGAFNPSMLESDISKIPETATSVLDWPNDETLQGQELYYHVEGLQLAAGGSPTAPKELISADAIGAKLSQDLGMHEPYSSIKGDGEVTPPPVDPNPPAKPSIAKP